MSHPDILRAECDRVLIDSMSKGLKATLAAELAKGASPQELLSYVRRSCVRQGNDRNCTVALQAWAYLEQLTGVKLE